MRVTLAKLLVLNPDMLLLDEPTNHLDLESCIWFEDYLKSYQGAVMVTSHDRAFLNRVAKKIIAIERDDVVFYHGSYDEFVEARKQDMLTLEATARRQESGSKRKCVLSSVSAIKPPKLPQVQSRLKAVAKIERVSGAAQYRENPFHFSGPGPQRR